MQWYILRMDYSSDVTFERDRPRDLEREKLYTTHLQLPYKVIVFAPLIEIRVSSKKFCLPNLNTLFINKVLSSLPQFFA
jgi:hypothetical protein